MISAGIPYSLPQGHEHNDVPTFWILLRGFGRFWAQGFGLFRGSGIRLEGCGFELLRPKFLIIRLIGHVEVLSEKDLLLKIGSALIRNPIYKP